MRSSDKGLASAYRAGAAAEKQLLPVYLLALTIGLCVAARVIFAGFLSIIKTGDSRLFLRLADNIRINFCYSASAVETHSCEPTWAQQPPGYPIILSLTRMVAGESDRAIIWMQTVLFVLAALYLCWVLYTWHRKPILLIVTIAVALFSPFSFGWSRAITTEFLSAVAVLLVFSEIARSIQVREIRILSICISVICGMLARWDMICLLVPVLLSAVLLYGLRNTLRRGMLIIAICALPYVGLMARAIAVGLPPIPTVLGGEATLPAGIIRFIRVAALDERAIQNLLWPIGFRDYQDIPYSTLDEYWAGIDLVRAAALLRELGQLPSGQTVPSSLDNEFLSLASSGSKDWFGTYVEVPLLRAKRMWLRWLKDSSSWVAFPSRGRSGLIRYAFFAYSLVVLGGLLAVTFSRDYFLRILAIAALSFVLARTAFLVSVPITALEVRYLDPFFPMIDVIAICSLWCVAKSRTLPGTRRFADGELSG